MPALGFGKHVVAVHEMSLYGLGAPEVPTVRLACREECGLTLPAHLRSSKIWTTHAESTPTLFLIAIILIMLAEYKLIPERGTI